MNLGKEKFHKALIVFWPEHLIATLRDPFTTPNYWRLADAYEHAAQDLMALHIFFLYLDKDKAAFCYWLHETAKGLAAFYRPPPPTTMFKLQGASENDFVDRLISSIQEAVERGDRVLFARDAKGSVNEQ